MNGLSRKLTGSLLVLAGLIICIVSFFTSFFILIYGIPIVIIGFFVFFNKKEDEIEQIKQKR
jgi:uncharacterized membrane protein